MVQHYIPSLLAINGVEAETDCSGAMTYVHWWGDGEHMQLETFYRDEVSGDLIEQMRCARGLRVFGVLGFLVFGR